MENSTSQTETTPTTNVPLNVTTANTQEPSDRNARMTAYLNKSEQFSKDTSRKVALEPNVTVQVLFSDDWYNDYDALMNDAIKNMKLNTLDASEYAEKYWKVKQSVKTGQDSKEEYSVTTYRVTQPNSSYPNMIRELDISSTKAKEEIENQLKKVCVDGGHLGKVLMNITKKMGGKSKFDVKWIIEGFAA